MHGVYSKATHPYVHTKSLTCSFSTLLVLLTFNNNKKYALKSTPHCRGFEIQSITIHDEEASPLKSNWRCYGDEHLSSSSLFLFIWRTNTQIWMSTHSQQCAASLALLGGGLLSLLLSVPSNIHQLLGDPWRQFDRLTKHRGGRCWCVHMQVLYVSPH